jgi:small ubiquitin-related modifier
MSEEAEDVKPKMNITINYEGQTITVKVRANTNFTKIFQAAEKKFGKEPGTFKFTAGGQRLRPEQTPAEMDLEDGDQIDAHLEQLGGAVRNYNSPILLGFRL